MKLRDVGEDRLLEQLVGKLPPRSGVVLGAGDDCAIVQQGKRGRVGLLKTDCVVEGVHFAKGALPRSVGWKAMARPLSDFAAMSGLPQFALVTLVVPATTDVSWVRQLYRGIQKAARHFDVAVVGGETSNTIGPAVVSISLSGFVERERWVSRAGGKAGDDVFVTGRLGGSLRGRHLRFMPRIVESRWLTENFRVHAMIDLSDGIGADLPRLAQASRVGFELDEAALPVNRGSTIAEAISDGEDYELLFAILPEASRSLLSRWKRKFPTVRLTRIGRLDRKPKIQKQKLSPGYVHFEER
jgi:thiamine-monophosphate kinase